MSTPPIPTPAPGEITQDEKTYATLAHALQIIGGWVAPLIIFLIKNNSKFVRFHALQALFLQLAVIVGSITLVVLWFLAMMVVGFASIAPQMQHPGTPPIGLIFLFPMLWLGIMTIWVVVLVIAVLYAIRAGRGEWAEYPLIGRWVRSILHIEIPPR